MKEIIRTDNAPRAIGPYSQAIKAGSFIFTAGQIGIDPKTGSVVEGGIEAETEQVLRNIQAILEAAGSSLDRVVKTTVYLADMGEFAQMNQVYERFFKESPPARSTVEAKLPKGVRVEIEAIATVD